MGDDRDCIDEETTSTSTTENSGVEESSEKFSQGHIKSYLGGDDEIEDLEREKEARQVIDAANRK